MHVASDDEGRARGVFRRRPRRRDQHRGARTRPLTAPIWYGYEPGGELWIVTERASREGRLLAQAGRFSLCAQSEQAPYST